MEIVKECHNKDFEVEKEFCLFFVYREVVTVLRSVFNGLKVTDFPHLMYIVREELLETIVQVVSGIRLYNRDCELGGQGISDVPSLLFKALTAVKTRLEEVKQQTVERVDILNKVVLCCHKVKSALFEDNWNANLPEWATEADLEYNKSLLIIYEQYHDFIEDLIIEVDTLKKATIRVDTERKRILGILHEHIIPNMNVLCTIVFPHFEELFEQWTILQKHTLRLVGIKHIFDELNGGVSQLKFENNLVAHASHLDEDDNPLQYYKKLPTGVSKLPIHSECSVSLKESLFFPSSRNYQFSGHCCWALVLSDGALLRGNEDHGVVQYKRCFYIFSSPLGVQCFLRHPQYYLGRVLELARKNSELISYLHIDSELRKLQYQISLYQEAERYIETNQCSTEIVPAPSNIDRCYESNVWIYRRNAMKMATLRQCKTESCQTEGTSFKTMNTQTHTPKEIATQTKVENHSNTPTPIRFLYGLRGRKDDKQLLLDLSYGEMKPSVDCSNKNK
ncbi:hypothetical protein JTB14_008070 [Gonioctena quinquepunctata]|nr:hypothetical protein JTB14_008070 [Gonioctena quinquepunctata]